MLLDYEPHSEQHWSPRMRITWRARYKLQPAGPRHPGPFDLDGPGNLRLKQAPQPGHHPQQFWAPHSRKHSFQVLAHCPAFIRSSCLRKSTRGRVSLNPIRTEPQRRGDAGTWGPGKDLLPQAVCGHTGAPSNPKAPQGTRRSPRHRKCCAGGRGRTTQNKKLPPHPKIRDGTQRDSAPPASFAVA